VRSWIAPGGDLGFVAGGKTADTTINNTVTYTTGGVTYAAPAIASGQVYRVKAFGTFVAVSSVTARDAQLACFWGTTRLTALSVAVQVSTAKTTAWQAEFVLAGTSTSAIWTTGFLDSRITSLVTTDVTSVSGASPVVSGAQTLDLRFAMSVSAAGDQWVVKQVTMERLK
jgi:hypothetical protein